MSRAGLTHTAASALRRPRAPIAESPAMREVLAAADDVAAAGTTVVILGESGTGKEVLARYIHDRSARSGGPWVAVNCAALPASLLESELFGHERGAFTGATERRIGRIEQAHGGTLLLDEVSELPLPLQAKLLRVLQEREVDRVGGTRSIPVDVRVIATSNRDLAAMVARGELRADLFYRLFVFPLYLPPLRERTDDLPALTGELLRAHASALGREAPLLEPQALEALTRYPFPGNVRELANVLERALVRCRAPVLELAHLDAGLAVGAAQPTRPHTTHLHVNVGTETEAQTETPTDSETATRIDGEAAPASELEIETDAGDGAARFDGLPLNLPELERLAIAEALRREGGNRTRAALRLGISLRTLRNKLRAYRAGERPRFGQEPGRHAEPEHFAGRQELPGTNDPSKSRARSATLAQGSQRPPTERPS